MQAETAYQQTLRESVDRDQIVLSHLPEVYYIATQMRERLPKYISMDDLVQAGVVGLIEAVNKYDPSRSASLGTFARHRIRGSMVDSIRQMDWASRRTRRDERELRAGIVALTQSLGRPPAEEEIVNHMGISLDDLWELTGRLNQLTLLNQRSAVNDRQGSQRISDLIEDAPSGGESAFDQFSESERKQKLAELIATLPEKEQMVLSLYYREELTMREIAEVLDLCESRISQLHSLALARLGALLEENKIDDQSW